MSILKSTKTGIFCTLNKETLEQCGLQVVYKKDYDLIDYVFYRAKNDKIKCLCSRYYFGNIPDKPNQPIECKLEFYIFIKCNKYTIDTVKKIEEWKRWVDSNESFDLSEYLK